MLYSNINLYSEEHNTDFGIKHGIFLGEGEECGCNQIYISCPDPTKVYRGMNRKLSIALSFLSNPKIIKRSDEDLYMILSTKGGSTINGNGAVLVPEHQKDQFKVLARARGGDIRFIPCGNGEDYTGYLDGHWDELIIKVPTDNAILQVCKSGSMYGSPPNSIYLIHDQRVYYCTYYTLEAVCSKFGIPLPCEVFPNGWGNLKLGGKWVRL